MTLADRFSLDAEVDAAADLVVSGSQGLEYFVGGEPTELTWPNGNVDVDVDAVEAGVDGRVWVTTRSRGSGPRVGRLEDGVLTFLPQPEDSSRDLYHTAPSSFAVGPDGAIWYAKSDLAPMPGSKSLLYFDGERRIEPDVPTKPEVGYFGPLAVGRDGTVWVYTDDEGLDAPQLVRFRDGEWNTFTETDGVPRLFGGQVYQASLAVDGAGTLWITFDGDVMNAQSPPPPAGPLDPPFGLLSFDGSTWYQYLAGHAVDHVEFGDDGTAWATSHFDCNEMVDGDCRIGDGLYVITPEAAAAAGRLMAVASQVWFEGHRTPTP